MRPPVPARAGAARPPDRRPVSGSPFVAAASVVRGHRAAAECPERTRTLRRQARWQAPLQPLVFDARVASPDAGEPRSATPMAEVPCTARRCRSSAIRSADSYGLLRVGAEAQFRRGEQAVDNVGRAFDAVIDELGLAGRPDDKERRGLALSYAGRE